MLTVIYGSAVYQVTPDLATSSSSQSTFNTTIQNTLKPEWLDTLQWTQQHIF